MPMTEEEFRDQMIEKIVCDIDKFYNDSYLDAVVDYCEDNEIDIESFAEFIKGVPSVVSKLQEEAEGLNILEKISRLPL
jgi:NADPH-dependent 7-cyano-7-deazaguanine reductase QueF